MVYRIKFDKDKEFLFFKKLWTVVNLTRAFITQKYLILGFRRSLMNKKYFLVILLLMNNLINGAFQSNQLRDSVKREVYIKNLLQLRAGLTRDEQNISVHVRSFLEKLDREIERYYASNKPYTYADES
jgi:hypothetical protein